MNRYFINSVVEKENVVIFLSHGAMPVMMAIPVTSARREF